MKIQISNFWANFRDWWLRCLLCEITLSWMSLDLTDDKSPLAQVMVWCHQTTSHYLSQCWPRSISPYGIIRLQWVNKKKEIIPCSPPAEYIWGVSWDMSTDRTETMRQIEVPNFNGYINPRQANLPLQELANLGLTWVFFICERGYSGGKIQSSGWWSL